MELKISAATLSKFEGKAKMFFDVCINNDIIVKGFKLVDGSNGMFVSNPREKSGEQYFDRVIFLNGELKSELENHAIQYYGNLVVKNKESKE